MGFNWWDFFLLRNFSVAISVSPRVCFILVLILIDFCVSKIMHLLARKLPKAALLFWFLLVVLFSICLLAL